MVPRRMLRLTFRAVVPQLFVRTADVGKVAGAQLEMDGLTVGSMEPVEMCRGGTGQAEMETKAKVEQKMQRSRDKLWAGGGNNNLRSLVLLENKRSHLYMYKKSCHRQSSIQPIVLPETCQAF